MTIPPHISIQLVHIQGPLKGEIQELDDSEIRIGRHPDCQVNFPKDQTTLSRVHARIVREGNRFKVIDQSTNGTYVNGQRITEIFLKDGDVVMFSEGGPKVSFLTQTGKKAPSVPQTITRVPPAPYTPHGIAAEPPAQPKPWSSSSTSPRATFSPAAMSRPSVPPVQPPRPQAPTNIETVKAPLAIQYGPALKSFHTLPIVIGSGRSCDFAISHPAVGERHAQIFFTDNQYWVKDLTGQNNIMLNGQTIHVQAPLEPNMQLALTSQGPRFRFIGGGRLAEIEDPLPQNSVPSSQAPPSAPPAGEKPGTSGKKIGLFKKFFS